MGFNKTRFLLTLVLGLAITLVMHALVYSRLEHHYHSYFIDYLFTTFCTFLTWELNYRIDLYYNKKLSWIKQPFKRLAYQYPTTLMLSAVLLASLMSLYGKWVCGSDPQKALLLGNSILIALIIVVLITTAEVCLVFFANWKNSLIEVEKYKTQSAKAQLQNLKNQINPHFLFNNMSVLSSLVYQDQDKAVDFINQLSKVYRYVLDKRNTELVQLHEEVSFLNAYIYLLKIRFAENINFKLDIEKEQLNKTIPPMCLQILVENIIKHNEISTEKPLYAQIYTEGDKIIIENKIQPRLTPEPSAKLGLNNIQERYTFLTEEKVLVENGPVNFKVTLPLFKTI